MYNIQVTGTQTMGSVVIRVSVSETEDSGSSSPLFSAATSTDEIDAGYESGSLEEFLMQFCRAVSRLLSSP